MCTAKAHITVKLSRAVHRSFRSSEHCSVFAEIAISFQRILCMAYLLYKCHSEMVCFYEAKPLPMLLFLFRYPILSEAEADQASLHLKYCILHMQNCIL